MTRLTRRFELVEVISRDTLEGSTLPVVVEERRIPMRRRDIARRFLARLDVEPWRPIDAALELAARRSERAGLLELVKAWGRDRSLNVRELVFRIRTASRKGTP